MSTGAREFTWSSHAATCARCKAVELARPATLAQACLEGSKLAKDAAAELAARERRQADDVAMGGGAR